MSLTHHQRHPPEAGALAHGIRENRAQFLHQLLQVLLVGFALGMMRTVVPALAESEFGVARGSFLLLTAFVGTNLFQSAFTGFCPAAMILKRLKVRPGTAFE